MARLAHLVCPHVPTNTPACGACRGSARLVLAIVAALDDDTDREGQPVSEDGPPALACDGVPADAGAVLADLHRLAGSPVA